MPPTFQYRVVADGCIDIVCPVTEQNVQFVVGYSATATLFPLLHSNLLSIGVRFLPIAFPLLFNLKASELTEQTESLSSILPDFFRYFKSRFYTEQPLTEQISLLNRYFMNILNRKKDIVDCRMCETTYHILTDPTQKLQTLHKDISERQLRRLFDFYIGDSPKSFAKVMRFQHFLHSRTNSNAHITPQTFYDFGYYDQSHFIKDFKTLYGLTPSEVYEKI